jgi:hypothetical protein
MTTRLAILAGLLALAGGSAEAHWKYEYQCCADNDCAPIDDRAVVENGERVIVTIQPGQHPMWPADGRAAGTFETTRRDLRKPVDTRWHVCLSPTGSLLCVYPPMRGV